MKIVVEILLCSVSLCVVGGDVCNESCTYSQVCGKDGICYELSELVTCSWHANEHYCKKEQKCCHGDCMPRGADCCSGSGYCSLGSVCKNGGCVDKTSVTWWQIVIIVVVCVAVFVAVFIWKWRYTRIKANNQAGRIVMVQADPVHTSLQSSSVQGHGNGQPGNIAVLVTNPR